MCEVAAMYTDIMKQFQHATQLE